MPGQQRVAALEQVARGGGAGLMRVPRFPHQWSSLYAFGLTRRSSVPEIRVHVCQPYLVYRVGHPIAS
jgi:hypothetical protein